MAGVAKNCPHCGATAYDGDTLECGYWPAGCYALGHPGFPCRKRGDQDGKRPGLLFQAAPRDVVPRNAPAVSPSDVPTDDHDVLLGEDDVTEEEARFPILDPEWFFLACFAMICFTICFCVYCFTRVL